MNLSIRFKILLFVGLIIAAVLGSLTTAFVGQLKHSYLDSIQQRATGFIADIVTDIKKQRQTSDNIPWILRIQTIKCIQLFNSGAVENLTQIAVLDRSGTIVPIIITVKSV